MQQSEAIVSTHASSCKLGSNVLLGTAIVKIKSKNGKFIAARALMDSASQLSFISSNLTKRLGIKPKGCNLTIAGIANTRASTTKSVCTVKLHSNVNNFNIDVDCAVLDNITSQLPTQYINTDDWNIPKDIQLSDAKFNQPSSIDLLLGADVFSQVMLNERRLKQNYPMLQETQFGWIVYGKCPLSCVVSSPKARHCNFVKLNNLEDTLQHFWEIEDSPQSNLSLEEKECEAHFIKHVSRDDMGSYEVRSPLRSEVNVSPSRSNAVNRRRQMKRRVDKDSSAEVNKELKIQAVSIPVTTADHSIFDRYSSFMKLIRVISYVFRFYNQLRRKVKSENLVAGPLTPVEINATTCKLIRMVQENEYDKEIHNISKGIQVQQGSKLKSLCPVISDVGLLLVGGRLANSELTECQKHPIILPPRHPFTKLLIIHEHERLLHSGPQATLFSLREKYWIMKGRIVVRSIIRNCYKCFRSKPTRPTHIMGQLPSCRVIINPPFTQVGVDYSGPHIIKGDNPRSKIRFKAYVALFICMSTKSIHLELVRSLKTEDFIAALKRFVARRGKPAIVHSDNGTNFVGTCNEFKRFLQENQERIIQYSTTEGIQWKFIPPSSPHFGGLWEAGVKSVKSLMKKVVGLAILNAEEFNTLLCQIESCLNSRPLCPSTDDPSSFSFITPGHFLIGKPLSAIPEPDFLETPTNHLNRWQLIQQLTQSFWKIWSKDYLHSLQQRSKWTSYGKWEPKINELVVLREDHLPPLVWRTGIITKLHPGLDGVVRVASVKTTNGIIKRALVKLSPFPKSE